MYPIVYHGLFCHLFVYSKVMCWIYFISATQSCVDMDLYLNPFLNNSLDLNVSGTIVEYECPLAQKFNQTVEYQNMTCEWNQTWSPTQLSPCIRK